MLINVVFKNMFTMNDLKFDREMKDALCKYNFRYFIEQNVASKNYKQEDVDKIHRGYERKKKKLEAEYLNNRKQYFLYLEGQVAKMFRGGLLPGLFNLNDIREEIILDFEGVGENWAYFEIWSRVNRRKVTAKKIWMIVVSIGSILGIVLTITKILEVLFFSKEL